MARSNIYENGFDEDCGRTLPETATCPECEGRLETDGGETACAECGLIVDEYRVDHTATPRDFNGDAPTEEHVGQPLTPTRHDRGLSTKIGRYRDANGQILSNEKRAQLGRLRREHARARWASTAEQNLAHACGEIARLVAALDLSFAVRAEASQLYREAQNANLIRGRSIEAIASGCVYAACRQHGQNRSVQEVADVARCPTEKVWLGYRTLSRELDLATGLVRPVDLLPKFADDADVPSRVERRAFELAEHAEQEGIANGRSPSGVAAACLYVAAQEVEFILTQERLAEIAGVTALTIRARYQELQACVDTSDITGRF